MYVSELISKQVSDTQIEKKAEGEFQQSNDLWHAQSFPL